MSQVQVWPEGTGPIYTGKDLTARQERVNNFHYNSVKHPVEPGRCCTDTCEICANKACAPIICLYETCVLGGNCCFKCIDKLKETKMKPEHIEEAKNTLKEIPPDGINMKRGGRRTRRRKRGGVKTYTFTKIKIEGEWYAALSPLPSEEKEIKLYHYKKVINNPGMHDAWYDRKYISDDEGGAFLHMHTYVPETTDKESKGGRTRRRKRKRRRKSTKKKRKRRRTKKKRRRTKKKRRRTKKKRRRRR